MRHNIAALMLIFFAVAALGGATAAKAEPAGVSYACVALAKGEPGDALLPAYVKNIASFYYTKEDGHYIWKLAAVNLANNNDNPNIHLLKFPVISSRNIIKDEVEGIQFSLTVGDIFLEKNKKSNLYLTLALPDVIYKYRCIIN